MSPVQRRLLARPEYEHGWLLFQSEEGEKRRFAPHPTDWAERPEDELTRWCAAARPMTYELPSVPAAPAVPQAPSAG